MSVSTHVLDTSRGCPAQGLAIVFEVADEAGGPIRGDDDARAGSRRGRTMGDGGPRRIGAAGDSGWRRIGAAVTNDDGRVPDLVGADDKIGAGIYRLTFKTGDWFAVQGVTAFYPVVHVQFEITDAAQHHHVPLLLSPFGYSTYRGS